MGAYTGVGERIRERLLKLGYQQPNGEPDVRRFGFDHRFDKSIVHMWLANTSTPFKELIRLCSALDVTAEWLLTGGEAKKARPGRARRNARNLLLVLGVGFGAMLPSPSVADAANATLLPPSYRKLRLLELGCI